MIRIAIVDDEETSVEKAKIIMQKYLKNTGIDYIINSYTEPNKFLNDFNQLKFHTLFIDIDMPVHSGFDISEKIREVNKDIPIIYITNRNDLVYQAFQYKAIGFIRKEHIEKELPDTLKILLKEIDINSNEISIIHSNKLYTVKISDIIYLHIENHDIYFHISEQEEVLKTRATLKSFSEMPEFSKFILMSSSYLVNYLYIFSIEKDCVLLTNNEKLYIPRRRIKDVKERFLYIMRGNL